MTRDDIIRMAEHAGFGMPVQVFQFRAEELERFAALVAAEKEQQMIRDGYRQCAQGQRTTQFCGLLDAAVKAEREACAKTCEEKKSKYDERVSKSEDERDIDPEVARIAKMTCDFNAAAIRARGKV